MLISELNLGVTMNKTEHESSNSEEMMLQMMRSLGNWESAIDKVSARVSSPEIQHKVHEIQNLYKGARGPMLVDVVASRRRRYDTHVAGRIIPVYKENARDLSIRALAENGPVGVTLWSGEAKTMVELAEFMLSFETSQDDEKTVNDFAAQSSNPEVRAKAIGIRGIGPVLYEYLRLLSGVDTLKADSRVREELKKLGVPQESFSDEGILNICVALASEVGCDLVDLDQALWNR